MSLVPLHAVAIHDVDNYPCVKETAVLMEIASSWPQLYEAARVMPNHCFDGYFAEGISDTLVRKMGQDWQGFVSQLNRKGSGDHFLPLVLRSINETLMRDDVEKVKGLAETSCPRDVGGECSVILKRIAEVFGDSF